MPLLLPKTEHIKPSGTGESPLANIKEWVNVVNPITGMKGRRDTNTMPQWAGSSWYFLRFIDPGNPDMLADPEKLKEWLPVDIYIGGAEHAVLHLLYAVSGINFYMILELYRQKNLSKNYLIKE